MKNYAEQQMGAVMDPNRYLNQSLNQITGMGGLGVPKKAELDDVRVAISMAQALASKVIAVEAKLLGSPAPRGEDESVETVHGVFPLLAQQSRDATFEMQLAENALDRILASI